MSDLELPEVERAQVFTPQPGDVVVLEVDAVVRPDDVAQLKAAGQAAFGHEVKVVVLVGARFSAVVRDGES